MNYLGSEVQEALRSAPDQQAGDDRPWSDIAAVALALQALEWAEVGPPSEQVVCY